MGLLAAVQLKWDGTDAAADINTAVVALQLFSLCGELKTIDFRAHNGSSINSVDDTVKVPGRALMSATCHDYDEVCSTKPSARCSRNPSMPACSSPLPRLSSLVASCPLLNSTVRSSLSICFLFHPGAALVVPVYLDAVTIVMGTVRSRIRKLMGKTGRQEVIDMVVRRIDKVWQQLLYFFENGLCFRLSPKLSQISCVSCLVVSKQSARSLKSKPFASPGPGSLVFFVGETHAHRNNLETTGVPFYPGRER